ncbi:IS3 family transposase [Capnocytophaga canis]|uniref:IS3 family transposase n=1 Tax=Capnocytophaga canis TaxID=1848903 RepID=UPI00370D7D48
MGKICKVFHISRQAFYKSQKQAIRKKDIENQIVDLVREERKIQPKLGVKKLYFLLKEKIASIGKIGRDKLFNILKNNDLLVKRKRKISGTNYQSHSFYKWKNIIENQEIKSTNEVWVSDITYLRKTGGFSYLFLVSDLYSRKILGWNLSQSLGVEGGISALKMALKWRKNKTKKLIHHSDKGGQYCCGEYVKVLKNNKIDISMTGKNHCYENATAERINGILKQEFLLGRTFKSFKETQKSVHQAIQIYNEKRPHWALNLLTPNQVFFQNQTIYNQKTDNLF